MKPINQWPKSIKRLIGLPVIILFPLIVAITLLVINTENWLGAWWEYTVFVFTGEEP